MLLGILLLFSWVSLVHVVARGFLRARNFEYVNAARALGLSDSKIILRHLLPNATVATLTFLPFIVNSSITTLTSLDFWASPAAGSPRWANSCCRARPIFRPPGWRSPDSSSLR